MLLHIFKETICAEDMANPLNQLPASGAEYLLAIYLVLGAFFFRLFRDSQLQHTVWTRSVI